MISEDEREAFDNLKVGGTCFIRSYGRFNDEPLEKVKITKAHKRHYLTEEHHCWKKWRRDTGDLVGCSAYDRPNLVPATEKRIQEYRKQRLIKKIRSKLKVFDDLRKCSIDALDTFAVALIALENSVDE